MLRLPIFDGVVTLNDDQVPVIIGLEDDGIRMSTNGTEIGEWSIGEFTIAHRGDGKYTITADNESLVFTPNRPDLFAVGLGQPLAARPSATAATQARSEGDELGEVVSGPDGAPQARPITRALFYTLAGTTGALGVWALYRLIF